MISNINLGILDKAIDLVRLNGPPEGSQEEMYLRAYPALLSSARARDHGPTEVFLRTAAVAFGWMPSRLQLDPHRLDAAVEAFDAARQEGTDFSPSAVSAVAACLQSLSAASSVLHLANPSAFPVWDSKIERFRQNATPSDYHMAQTTSYLAYVEDVQKIMREQGFLGFHHDFCMNYQERLRRLRIPAYPLTNTRVVESAVYEIINARRRRL